jgi:hypothetical protein
MHPPNSLKDLNANPKFKIMEEKQIGVHFLARNTSRVRMACWNFEMRNNTNDKKVNYSYGYAQAK